MPVTAGNPGDEARAGAGEPPLTQCQCLSLGLSRHRGRGPLGPPDGGAQCPPVPWPTADLRPCLSFSPFSPRHPSRQSWLGKTRILIENDHKKFPAHSRNGPTCGDGESSESSEMRVEIMNPCTDFAFKLAFSDPEILIPFLNDILDFNGDAAISQVTYLDPNFPSTSILGRHFTSDLLCSTSCRKYILIEMQNDFNDDYSDKALLELCRLTSRVDTFKIRQALQNRGLPAHHLQSRDAEAKSRENCGIGNVWKEIDSSIALVITNKQISSDHMKKRFQQVPVMEPNVVNTYEMLHIEDHTRRLGDIQFKVVLVMLANFRKDIHALGSKAEQWFYALKDPGLSSGKSKIDRFKVIDPVEFATRDNDGVKLLVRRSGLS